MPKLAGLTPAELIASGATNYRRWVNFPWAVVERGGQVEAGAWTPADAARLGALTALAHAPRPVDPLLHAERPRRRRRSRLDGELQLRIGRRGRDALARRARRRRRLHRLDQYEGLARVLARPPAVAAQGAASTGAPAPGERPGARGGGVTLLPNGWRIAPAGKHLQAGDFPLAMTATPDRRFLVITNNGFSKPSLTVIDTERWAMKARVPVEHAWLGLAWDAARQAALLGRCRREHRARVRLRRRDAEAGDADDRGAAGAAPAAGHDRHGGHRLRRRHRHGGGRQDALRRPRVRPRHQRHRSGDRAAVRTTVPLPAEPYTVLPAADGRRVFVSLWGGAKVLALDAATLAVTGEVAVGAHPNAMALSKDGQRLFVACANTNKVWALDTATLDGPRADRRVAVPGGAAGDDAERAGRLARRRDAGRRQRRQQHRRADRHRAAGPQRGRRASSRPAGIRPSVLFDRRRHASCSC